MKKKLISSLLAISILASMSTTAFAGWLPESNEIDAPNGSTDVPVELNVTPLTFSVTVPSVLPITVNAEGRVVTATDTKITNNSAGKIEVKSIEVVADNGWVLKSMTEDFINKSVNTKEFAMSFNDVDAINGNIASTFGLISADASQSFTYNAKVAPQSENITKNTIASVTFVIGWNQVEHVTENISSNGGRITWDGNNSGLVTTGEDEYATWAYYKVSDKLLSEDELANAVVGVQMDVAAIKDTNIEYFEGITLVTFMGDWIGAIIIPEDNMTVEEFGETFPEAGTYFFLEQQPDAYNTYTTSLTWGDKVSEYYDLREDRTIYSLDGKTLHSVPVSYGEEYTIPNGITNIGNYAFYYCENLTSVDIPDSVTTIGAHAFSDCGLIDLVIPDSVTTIGDWAFSGCRSLESAEISKSITTTGNYVFAYTDSLTGIEIPSNIISIGDGAFMGSGLESIIIPDSVTSIGEGAFSMSYSLTSVKLSKNLTSIGDGAFNYCTVLPSIELPSSLTTIGTNAFANCRSFTSIVIPDSVTYLGNGAFNWCQNLESIVLSKNITSIEKHTFYQCPKLNNVVIPEGVTIIDEYAFCFCNNLTNIVIPKSVKTIKGNVFDSGKPADIYYTGTEAEWNSINIDGSNNYYINNATIHYEHVMN